MRISKENQTAAMLIHTSALLCLLLPGFGQLLGPLVAWMLLRGRDDVLDEQGRAAVNFQLSMFIGLVVASGLLFALAATLGMLDDSGAALSGVGFAVMFVFFWIVPLVHPIKAAIAASKGQPYRYPFSLKLLK